MDIIEQLRLADALEAQACLIKESISAKVNERVRRWFDIIKHNPKVTDSDLLRMINHLRQPVCQDIFVDDIGVLTLNDRVRVTIRYGGGEYFRMTFDSRIFLEDDSVFQEIEREVQSSIDTQRMLAEREAEAQAKRAKEARRALLKELLIEFCMDAVEKKKEASA